MRGTDVEVWLARTDVASTRVAACSADEIERARRFRTPSSGEQWLAARGALRAVLSAATGIDPAALRFGEGPHGRPFLERQTSSAHTTCTEAPDTETPDNETPDNETPDIEFNLSHSGSTVAIAVAGRPVGIDIEGPRRLLSPDRLARRLLAPEAHARWSAQREPARTRELLQQWTRTEALLKATGTGLGGGSAGAVNRLAVDGWRVVDLAVAPLVGAVAAPGTDWVVRGPRWLDEQVQPPAVLVDPDVIDAETLLGLLAEPVRLKVVAALVLGAETLSEIVAAAALAEPLVRRALQRLVATPLVTVTAGSAGTPATYRLRHEHLRDARAKRRDAANQDEAVDKSGDSSRQVLRNFVRHGRLTSIPASRTKRLAVLDYLAARFEPGRTYPERDVNTLLGAVHPDYAALRRYLVDEGFLERRDGFYWRAGGSFEVD